VDVAAAGALAVVAAEVAEDGCEEVDWVADALDAAVVVTAGGFVVDPPVVVPVHPDRAAAIARQEIIATRPGRTPDPVPMA